MKNKIKVMNRPQLSDEEIRSHMDFEKLLATYSRASDSKHSISIRVLAGISVLVLLLLATWFVTNQKSEPEEKPLTNGAFRENLQNRSDPPIDSIEILDQPAQKTESKAPSERTRTKEIQPRSEAHVNEKTETKKDTVSQRTPAKEIVPVYKQAEPIAGYQHLYEYFSRELTYPVKMIPDSVEGVVSVAFTINASGRPEKITIEQSLGEAFDEEAIRLVEKMPEWKPATYGEKPVASRLSIPITFQVTKAK